MNFLAYLRKKIEEAGYMFLYGDLMQLNRAVGEVDFSQSRNSSVMFCRLITEEDGGDRPSATIGLYGCKLSDFDFGEFDTVEDINELKQSVSEVVESLDDDNVVSRSAIRYSYGYADFADDVLWCCARMTITARAAEYRCPE